MATAELHELVDEIRKTREGLEQGDQRVNGRIDQIEKSLNEIYRKVNRPLAEGKAANDNDLELRSAVGLCHTRRALTVPKIDAGVADNYEPSPAQIHSLVTLCRYLCNTFHIPPDHIYTHGGVTGKTDCPGKLLDVELIRSKVAASLAY